MIYGKLMSICAAIAITGGTLVMLAPPAAAKGKPIVVEAAPEDVLTERVSFADLNLASVEGRQTLNRRVGSAVKSVCIDSIGDTSNVYAGHACRNYAWAGARPQIDRAVQRAREIAAVGFSSIPVTAIRIAAPE